MFLLQVVHGALRGDSRFQDTVLASILSVQGEYTKYPLYFHAVSSLSHIINACRTTGPMHSIMSRENDLQDLSSQPCE